MKPAATLFVLTIATAAFAGESRVPLVFRGGHETDPRDHGRPVALVAGALGVSSVTFRAAFSRVHPAAPGERPGSERVHANKDVLLAALDRYGITNDRLDEVSDHYRYRPDSGELWPTREAKGYAILQGGVVKRIVVTDGGEGYTSAPTVSLGGRGALRADIKLWFSRDFARNGRIAEISLARR